MGLQSPGAASRFRNPRFDILDSPSGYFAYAMRRLQAMMPEIATQQG